MVDGKKYCVFCGTENKLEDKKCIKCHKKLNPRSDLIQYIKNKIKSDAQDKFLETIKKLLKTYLYGTVVTCSIIATVTTVILVNKENSHIKKVTQKPEVTSRYIYAGEGLEPLEVANKYIEAIRTNDIETVQNLQLENFFPEIREEIIEYAKSLNLDIWDSPVVLHDLVANGSLYFDDWSDDYMIFDNNEEIIPIGKYGNYNYIRYLFLTTYTYDENDVGKYIDNNFRLTVGLYIRDVIELIEVDGNYYINGEDINFGENYGERLGRKEYILKNVGDYNNISLDA